MMRRITEEMLHQFTIKSYALHYCIDLDAFHFIRGHVMLSFSCEKYHVFYGNIYQIHEVDRNKSLDHYKKCTLHTNTLIIAIF